MNIIRGKREHPEPERADGGAGGTLGRRHVLGGLAALPVLVSVGSAAPALAASAVRPGSTPAAAGDLLRGAERRYNAPLLTPGTRLALPAGSRPCPSWITTIARTSPRRRQRGRTSAAGGTTVDASVIPGRGAPTRIAIVSGFTEGWYELTHASGRADRVMWDAGTMPCLFVYGEFGGTDEEPFRDRFYTLALQPMSRNPYPRSTTIG